MNTERMELETPKDRLKFTREQLNSALQQPVRIELPSGAVLEIIRGGWEIYATYYLENRPRYTGSLEQFSTLAQILRALVQEGSKIPEEDQAYIRDLLPRERKRSPRRIKNPDACPFCGSLGELTGYPWGYHYIVCPNCQARTGDTLSVEEAWELWRRRRA